MKDYHDMTDAEVEARRKVLCIDLAYCLQAWVVMNGDIDKGLGKHTQHEHNMLRLRIRNLETELDLIERKAA